MTQQAQRYYVKYTFYKLDQAWRRLPQAQKTEGAEALAATVNAFSDEMLIRSYNLQGMRGDADFMFWQVTPQLEAIQEFAVRLADTGLGRFLETPYSYLAMTRRSPYVDSHRHEGQEGRGAGPLRPKGAKYLIVYPFWKTRTWYRLSAEERQKMMNVHFEVGHKYSTVKINTAYSFGLDDQEFMVSFETERPEDFLDLVMELRETDASLYTLRDTPIFTCVSMDVKDIVAGLVGGNG